MVPAANEKPIAAGQVRPARVQSDASTTWVLMSRYWCRYCTGPAERGFKGRGAIVLSDIVVYCNTLKRNSTDNDAETLHLPGYSAAGASACV